MTTLPRITLLAALSLIMLSVSPAQGKEPDLLFTDHQRAQILLNHDGYIINWMFFSGQCPGSRRQLTTHVKNLHDRIEAKQLPVVLVLVTPDNNPDELQNLAKSLDLEHALFAQDRNNALNISLRNVWQTRAVLKGKQLRDEISADNVDSLAEKHQARPRFKVDGLDDPRARELWWRVERATPGALELLAHGSQRRNPIQEQAQALLPVVEPWYRQREEALVTAEATIDTFEGLEQLISEARPLGLTRAEARYRELSRDRSLRDEIAARTAYQRIETEFVNAAAQQKQRQAPAAFAQLAERFPDTKYGRLAAQR
ncbi:MAG: hypothetical protein EA402_05550 [Planctomycetota bacterium]|nr:MAG: hypothetical protein EA402_05550 [Planctomycetota bacterium]